jgi:hypothetical protein
MSDDKNRKDESLNSAEGYDYVTYDDGVMMFAEPADDIAFAKLERQGYTLVKDDSGKVIAAITPKG